MNSGKKNGQRLEPVAPPMTEVTETTTEPATMPEAYLACAKWLLANPHVLEVWGMVSDLPEIAIPETAVTLDAGAWFLCRVSMPPLPEGEGIISFIQNSTT